MTVITKYPDTCASEVEWSSCSNNCIGLPPSEGTKGVVCSECNPLPGDPCGISLSGLGCVPDTCSSMCCKPNEQKNMRSKSGSGGGGGTSVGLIIGIVLVIIVVLFIMYKFNVSGGTFFSTLI